MVTAHQGLGGHLSAVIWWGRGTDMGLIRLQSSSLPSGSVLQVVQGSTSTEATHTSTSTWTDTGLSASITPSSASNKILVQINQHCFASRYGGSLKLLRDTTGIWEHGESYGFYLDPGTNINARLLQSFNYLDTPSSTSALTYKTQGKLYPGGSWTTQQGSNFESFITLMEIAV